jgi:hypothetical protein
MTIVEPHAESPTSNALKSAMVNNCFFMGATITKDRETGKRQIVPFARRRGAEYPREQHVHRTLHSRRPVHLWSHRVHGVLHSQRPVHLRPQRVHGVLHSRRPVHLWPHRVHPVLHSRRPVHLRPFGSFAVDSVSGPYKSAVNPRQRILGAGQRRAKTTLCARAVGRACNDRFNIEGGTRHPSRFDTHHIHVR